MIHCETTRERITEALHEDAPLGTAAESHMESCAACRQWRKEVGVLRKMVADLPPLRLPEGFTEGVLRRRRRARVKVLSIAAAASAALLLALGIWWLAPRSTPTPPETEHVRGGKSGPPPAPEVLGRHVHVSQLFFRQAAKAESERDLEVLRHELELTGLRERNFEILDRGSKAVRQMAAAVDRALEPLEEEPSEDAARRLREAVERTGVLSKIEKLKAEGVEPRPLEGVEIASPPEDPSIRSFLQARAHMYSGTYDKAEALFAREAAEPWGADARYWAAICAGRQERFVVALDRLLRAYKGRWRDRETAREIQALAEQGGALLMGRDPAEMAVEDVEAMMKDVGYVGLYRLGNLPPLVQIVSKDDPLLQKMRKLEADREAGKIGETEYRREYGKARNRMKARARKILLKAVRED